MANGKKEIGKVDRAICGALKVKGIFLTNTIELELPSSIKIHSVVNVS